MVRFSIFFCSQGYQNEFRFVLRKHSWRSDCLLAVFFPPLVFLVRFFNIFLGWQYLDIFSYSMYTHVICIYRQLLSIYPYISLSPHQLSIYPCCLFPFPLNKVLFIILGGNTNSFGCCAVALPPTASSTTADD